MTAVEYLINELSDIIGPIEATLSGELLLAGAIKRAKDFEKEQMIEFAKNCLQENDCFFDIEKYYNETFKSE